MKFKKNALCIVAHPDDETIWMGGFILHNKNWNWTILSLCRKNDLDRMPKFLRVCKEYNANGIISDLDDEVLKPLNIYDLSLKIFNLLPLKIYDFIFTHGKNGEYGHLRHKETNKAVLQLINQKKLFSENKYCFNYIPGSQISPHDKELKIPIPNKNTDLLFNLTPQEFKNKYMIIHELYGFKNNIFETLSCSKSESFSILQ